VAFEARPRWMMAQVTGSTSSGVTGRPTTVSMKSNIAAVSTQVMSV
jgi:hypothetical protein